MILSKLLAACGPRWLFFSLVQTREVWNQQWFLLNSIYQKSLNKSSSLKSVTIKRSKCQKNGAASSRPQGHRERSGRTASNREIWGAQGLCPSTHTSPAMVRASPHLGGSLGTTAARGAQATALPCPALGLQSGNSQRKRRSKISLKTFMSHLSGPWINATT